MHKRRCTTHVGICYLDNAFHVIILQNNDAKSIWGRVHSSLFLHPIKVGKLTRCYALLSNVINTNGSAKFQHKP